MIPYLEKEHHKQPIGQIPARYARVEASIKGNANENQLFELIVDRGDDKVAQKKHVKGKHSYIDANYMKEVEAACLANEEVQAEIRTLDLPAGATVVVEPWAYATDGMNDMTERVTMVGPIICVLLLMLTLISAGSTFDCWKVPTPTTTPIPSTSVLKSRRRSMSQRSIAFPPCLMKESTTKRNPLTAEEFIQLPQASITLTSDQALAQPSSRTR